MFWGKTFAYFTAAVLVTISASFAGEPASYSKLRKRLPEWPVVDGSTLSTLEVGCRKDGRVLMGSIPCSSHSKGKGFFEKVESRVKKMVVRKVNNLYRGANVNYLTGQVSMTPTPVCNLSQNENATNSTGESCGKFCKITIETDALNTDVNVRVSDRNGNCSREYGWARGFKVQLIYYHYQKVLSSFKTGSYQLTSIDGARPNAEFAADILRVQKARDGILNKIIENKKGDIAKVEALSCSARSLASGAAASPESHSACKMKSVEMQVESMWANLLVSEIEWQSIKVFDEKLAQNPDAIINNLKETSGKKCEEEANNGFFGSDEDRTKKANACYQRELQKKLQELIAPYQAPKLSKNDFSELGFLLFGSLKGIRGLKRKQKSKYKRYLLLMVLFIAIVLNSAGCGCDEEAQEVNCGPCAENGGCEYYFCLDMMHEVVALGSKSDSGKNCDGDGECESASDSGNGNLAAITLSNLESRSPDEVLSFRAFTREVMAVGEKGSLIQDKINEVDSSIDIEFDDDKGSRKVTGNNDDGTDAADKKEISGILRQYSLGAALLGKIAQGSSSIETNDGSPGLKENLKTYLGREKRLGALLVLLTKVSCSRGSKVYVATSMNEFLVPPERAYDYDLIKVKYEWPSGKEEVCAFIDDIKLGINAANYIISKYGSLMDKLDVVEYNTAKTYCEDVRDGNKGTNQIAAIRKKVESQDIVVQNDILASVTSNACPADTPPNCPTGDCGGGGGGGPVEAASSLADVRDMMGGEDNEVEEEKKFPGGGDKTENAAGDGGTVARAGGGGAPDRSPTSISLNNKPPELTSPQTVGGANGMADLKSEMGSLAATAEDVPGEETLAKDDTSKYDSAASGGGQGAKKSNPWAGFGGDNSGVLGGGASELAFGAKGPADQMSNEDLDAYLARVGKMSLFVIVNQRMDKWGHQIEGQNIKSEFKKLSGSQ